MRRHSTMGYVSIGRGVLLVRPRTRSPPVHADGGMYTVHETQSRPDIERYYTLSRVCRRYIVSRISQSDRNYLYVPTSADCTVRTALALLDPWVRFPALFVWPYDPYIA